MPLTKDKTKAQSAGEVNKLHKRIAELEESHKKSKDIEKIITIQRNLALKLNATKSLEHGLRLCLEAAIKVSGMDSGGVYLFDDVSGDLNLVCHESLPAAFVKSAFHFEAQSPNTKLIMKGKPIYSKHRELGVPVDKTLRRENLLAIAVIPIQYKKKVIACLNVASHTLDEVPVQSRTSLETIAGQMGSAIAHLKAEKALIKSEAKYRSSFDNSRDAINVFSKDKKIIHVNKSLLRLSGYSEDNLLSMELKELFPEAGSQQAVERIRTLSEGKEIPAFETYLLTKKGEKIPVEIGITLLKNCYGEEFVFQGNIRDITRRKKTESELRKYQEELKTIFNSVPTAIWYKDSDNKFLRVNKQAADSIGMKVEDIENKPLEELFPIPDAEHYYKDDLEVMDSGKSKLNIIEEMQTSSGERKWVCTDKVPYKNEEGKINGVIVFARDITEQKKTEESLGNERKYLKIMNDVSNELNTNGSLNNVTDIILQGLNLHGANIGLLEKDNRLYIRGASADLNKMFANAARSLFFDFNTNATARNYFDSLDEIKTLSINELFNLISDKGSLSSKIIKTLISELSKTSVGETIIAPLKNSVGDRIGVVLLTKKPDQIFTLQERALVDSLCGTLALAIDKIIGEQKLQESEVRYRLLLESISDSVYVLDREWRHVIVNDAATDFVRIPKGKLIGGKLTELFPGVEETPFFKIFKKVMKTRKPDIVTNEYEFEGGRKNYYEVHVYPVPEGILCISRDVTEKKLAEEAIKQERNQLINILNSMEDGIYIVNREYDIQYVNPVLQKEFGTPDGKKCYHYFHNKRKACPWCKNKDVFAGKTVRWEWYSDKTGKTYDLVDTPLKNPDGSISKLEIFHNITERKQYELKIKESRERLNAIFEHVQTGIVIIDEETHEITDLNPAAERMIGVKKEKAVGRSCHKFICPAEKGKCPITDLGQTIDNSERVLLGISGNEVPILKTVVPMVLDGRKYLIDSFVDLTEKKNDEREKLELESQLRQVEKMESIGQLAGGIAHDFNNQLGSIVGFADLIREMVMDDAKLSHYADNILITARRSADITRQLLAFARKGKYESVKVDMHDIIHEVISLLKHSIQKKIVIKQHLKANPSTTMGDSSQLQNAILNIAINARDAMPGSGELVFSTDTLFLDTDYCKSLHYKLSLGDYLQICITDTGSGMDSETIQHIFEPFYTTKGVGKGTGMGLAAVYGTIKNHNGAIEVYSKPGHGTTFKIYLPLKTEGVGEDTDFFKRTDIIKGSSHILLADDEEILCEMAKDMIETLGYKITICRDGKEAIEVYKKSWKDIDLIILDMVMPEMDGKDAYLAMRKINPDVKVLLSSGYSITGQARELLSKGVDDFIQKPYRKTELSQKIAKVLGNDK